MADLSDVSNAIGLALQTALYPNQQTPSGNSAAGVPILIQVGWPDPASLDKLVSDFNAAPSAPRVIVTIYPLPSERNTTRYSEDDVELGVPDATYTLTAAGQVITVGGQAQAHPYSNQNLVTFVNRQPFAVQSVGGETPTALAALLQQAIVAVIAGTTVSGAAITLPNTALIGALRVGTVGSTIKELKRQERDWQMTVWAPSPALRDAVAKVVDPALAAQTFLSLADGTGGRFRYKGSPYTDFDQKQGLYRRDFVYTCEYGTTTTTAGEQIVQTELNLQPSLDLVTPNQTITLYD